MIRALYTAATGMNSMQDTLDVTANNIANANTIGFKKDRAEFQDLMYESLNYTAGRTSETTINPTGIDVGLGVRTGGIQKIFLEGDLEPTGNPLDVAIEGSGFFQVTMPNGEIAYTRSGNFKLDGDGNIVNSNGYPIEPQITVPDNVTDISIAKDGTVSATDPTTGDTVDLGQIQIATFINPAGLTPLGDSLFLQNEAAGDPVVGNPNEEQFGALRQSMVEMSNVKLVEEMVNLITAQRAYESNSKAITAADQMLDTVNGLKR